MSHVFRPVQVLFWAGVCLLLAPSKATAIAYALVIAGLLVAVLISLGIIRGIISVTKKLFAKPPRG